jgi:hypothetical protein
MSENFKYLWLALTRRDRVLILANAREFPTFLLIGPPKTVYRLSKQWPLC